MSANGTHFSGPLYVEGDIITTTGAVRTGTGAYESLTAARTLVAADNGITFGLNLAGGGALTMPTAAAAGAGWKIRFRIETAITTAWIATFADGEMGGNIAIVDIVTTVDGSFDAVGSIITFVASAETIGDWCDVECTGTKFFVSGCMNLTGAITLTGT